MVVEDGNLLDEFFDQSLIKLCYVGFLLGDEVLQLLDPVHGLFPVVAVNFGLFLLLPEAENLIGDGVVVLLVICLLMKSSKRQWTCPTLRLLPERGAAYFA